MADYKELIGQLNGACIVKVVMKDMTKADLFARAADAIEQLIKERDAAVADLKEGGFCMTCKHLVSTQEEKLCMHCSILTGGGEDNWEWRGVQEDNDEVD